VLDIDLTSTVDCHSLAAAWLRTAPNSQCLTCRPCPAVCPSPLTRPLPLPQSQRALGPPAPEFYINVIIAMEDVVLRREWDVRENKGQRGEGCAASISVPWAALV
jgi:hypothetical protein